MNTTGKTMLITGGGSGIGFQIAKLFSEKGNKVIITGRNEEKLKESANKLNDVDYFAVDVTKANELDSLVNYITTNYPSLDVLVNNAANTSVYNLGPDADALKKAELEILTNYLSVVSLTEKLLPGLAKQSEAAIVNVTSILALTPSIQMPTHSASKAALRAYTQILRFTLDKKASAVKVFEVVPPLVNTEFSKEIGGANGIPAVEVAEALIQGFENNTFEILIGQAEGFYNTFFAESGKALAALHQGKG